MAHLWQTAREWLHKRNPHRLTPVFEVLKTQEEAKDHVYYDALRRISASNSKDGQTIIEGTSSVSRKGQNSDIDRNGNVPSRSLEDVTEEDVEESPTQPRPRTLFRHVFVVREFILQALKSERFVVDSEDDVYYLWMGLVAAAVIFNFWTVILRIAFFQQTREESLFRLVFWLGDLLADGLYTCDIGVQLRTAYRDDHGIMVKDPLQLVEKYRKKRRFKVDLICVLPLETLSHLFYVPCRVSLLRLPRLLKWHSVQTFFLLSDYRTSKPNHLRAFKLILYLGVAMHWVACLYYTISEYEGLGTNDWVYSGEHDHFTRKYVKSFYWSVLTLMTIGETPSPHTNLEYIFTGCMFLLGIFVFATVVGNVGDVISNMNAARTNFQARMDSIKQFMEHHKVPKTLQTRVKRWAHYSWSRTQALEEGASLEVLPERLRAEIAIHVHLDTLRKVKIFKDCEQGLLCELVLKLRPQIFSPGDYICRSGEVGREMYIINNGKVEVVIPDSCTGEEVAVASLSEGNYFGEISLLRLDGGRNRRSADVRSVGYSELLCLSQKDLMEALEEYPDAKTVLESQGRDRLQRTKWEGHLSVPRTDQESEKFHEMGTNLAREIKVIKDILEELRENAREVPGRVTIQELQKEFLDLKTQVRQQTEELHRLKRQITSQNHLLPGDTRRSKSNKEALLAEKLIQRVISAANLASHNANNSQKSRTLNGVEHAQEHPSTKPDSLARDPPDIYLESEIDGLCYLGGTHRTSVNLPVRGCNSGNLEPNASLDKLEGGGNE